MGTCALLCSPDSLFLGSSGSKLVCCSRYYLPWEGMLFLLPQSDLFFELPHDVSFEFVLIISSLHTQVEFLWMEKRTLWKLESPL